MIIEGIKLSNFRNHDSYERNFTDNITLILGENGSGKTSILEAIYILMQGKSFRASDPEIIKTGKPFYRAEIKYESGEKIVATYEEKTGKTFKIDEKKSKRLPAKNRYPVVFFAPNDLNLISHAPGRRRAYFDELASKLYPGFTNIKNRYEKALKQRNELLKSEHEISQDDIFSWNLLLARYGSEISKYREKIIEKINENIEKFYQKIAKNSDKISIIYENSTKSPSEELYLSQLERDFERDRLLGHTSFGVQKDDFIFMFNDKKADTSASRGETRSIIIALKFVETELLANETGKDPLVMLDDVFSELDSDRRHALIENFGNHQIILTSVEQIF